jgi:hypothetical protein
VPTAAISPRIAHEPGARTAQTTNVRPTARSAPRVHRFEPAAPECVLTTSAISPATARNPRVGRRTNRCFLVVGASRDGFAGLY